MSRGNVLGMMWGCSFNIWISEGDTEFNTFNGGDTFVPNAVIGFRDCQTSQGPYQGINEGLYEGFVYSTYCSNLNYEHWEANNFSYCTNNNNGEKIHVLTIKELINQKWILAPGGTWFYKISSD